ncbi:hypothetical protein [Wocania ichthyoenteri]|uniref:hypothetical protein n=1 Tax=Wocania ichthyoenteri TaxID=1230531 RepID=UPI00053EB6BA|nr:hypothetical protein [Wocania ichthyoenteri]
MKTNIPKLLLALLLVAIIYLLLYIFVFLDKTEIFYKASEVGILFYRLTIGYIAATMFYFIVNYFPQKRKANKMLANLDTQVNKIEANINKILSEFNYPNEQEILTLENYSSDSLKLILENTKFDFVTKVNYVGQQKTNVIKHIEVQVNEINNELKDIEKHIDLISPELFKTLKDVQRMPISRVFVAGIDMVKREKLQNQNLGIFTDLFVDYLNKVKEFKFEWEKNKN